MFPSYQWQNAGSLSCPSLPYMTFSTEWRQLSLGSVLLTNKQLCAGDVMKGTSSGDSGGPLLVRDKFGRLVQVSIQFFDFSPVQIGITSFGASGLKGMLNQKQYPGVYTRVSAYADWIDLVVASSGSSLSLQLILVATKLYF